MPNILISHIINSILNVCVKRKNERKEGRKSKYSIESTYNWKCILKYDSAISLHDFLIFHKQKRIHIYIERERECGEVMKNGTDGKNGIAVLFCRPCNMRLCEPTLLLYATQSMWYGIKLFALDKNHHIRLMSNLIHRTYNAITIWLFNTLHCIYKHRSGNHIGFIYTTPFSYQNLITYTILRVCLFWFYFRWFYFRLLDDLINIQLYIYNCAHCRIAIEITIHFHNEFDSKTEGSTQYDQISNSDQCCKLNFDSFAHCRSIDGGCNLNFWFIF